MSLGRCFFSVRLGEAKEVLGVGRLGLGVPNHSRNWSGGRE